MQKDQQKLMELIKGKKVAFIGAGVSHKTLIKEFVELGAHVTLCDQKKSVEDFGDYAATIKELGIDLSLGENYLDGFKGQDIIMRTPGFVGYFEKPLQDAMAAGTMVTSEVELFFDFCPCEIVAVTGSDAKDATYYPNIGPNGIDTSGTLVMEYDGFSAVCTGSKDSDSPGYVCVQGEKGFMKVDSKPNIASELKTVYADENIKEKVKDAAGAMVRATITEDYKAPEHHHRMTQEFTDFARVIDEKDYETAKEFLDETVAVVKVLETARKKAGIEF